MFRRPAVRHRWLWIVAHAALVLMLVVWLVGELGKPLTERERADLWSKLTSPAASARPPASQLPPPCDLALQAAERIRRPAVRSSRRPPLPPSAFEEARVYAAALEVLFLPASPQSAVVGTNAMIRPPRAYAASELPGRGPVPVTLVLASITSFDRHLLPPWPLSTVDALSTIGCSFAALRGSTLAAFWLANRAEQTVSLPFMLPVAHQTVRGRMWELWGRGGVDAEFYRAFPGSNGIIGLSRVGFDTPGEQAMVFVEYGCGGACGEGFVVVLERGPRGWSVVEQRRWWVS